MAAGTFKLTDKDTGWNALKETLRSLRGGNSYAKVGLLGEKAAAVEHEAEEQATAEVMTNVALAAIHEFGTAHVPERSFIRTTFDAKREDYVALLRKLVPAIYEGKASPWKVLSIVGMQMKWDMKNAILQGSGIPPPLAPSTVAAKKRKARWRKTPAKDAPRPLVDTGRLVAAIDHGVVIQGRDTGGTEDRGSAALTFEEKP
jgi:hypothetical protein